LTRIFSSCDSVARPLIGYGALALFVTMNEAFLRCPAEVDDHIGALAGGDQQRRHRLGRAQQPALGPQGRASSAFVSAGAALA
jgi:hypothetical protein